MSAAPFSGAGSLVPVVTYDDIVALLRAGVAEAGSQRAYAQARAIHEGDLSQVLRERRLPTERMALWVGVERHLVRVGDPISPMAGTAPGQVEALMPHATREPAGDKGTADRIGADDGHFWVRLVTRQAMDREGATMGHCVGDGGYDEHAGSEEMADNAIWSLRRPDGVSVLTAQVRYLELDYAKGPKNSDPGRFESLQVAHLVAGFKEAGHALKVDEDTGIVLLEDGRTFRVDRLPPDVVAARAEAARRMEEERGRAFVAVRSMRSEALSERYFIVNGRADFRPAGSPTFIPLGDVASFELVGGGSFGYGPGGGAITGFHEGVRRLLAPSYEESQRPAIQAVTTPPQVSTLERVRRVPVGMRLFDHEISYEGPWDDFRAYTPGMIVCAAGLPYINLHEVRMGQARPQDEGAVEWRLLEGDFVDQALRHYLTACEFLVLPDVAQTIGRVFEARRENARSRIDNMLMWSSVLGGSVVSAVPWSEETVTSPHVTIDTLTPDGFEARWEGATRTIEQAQAPSGLITQFVESVSAGYAIRLGPPDGGGAWNVTDVEIRARDGTPIPQDQYAVDGAMGIVIFHVAAAGLTIRFRAGPRSRFYSFVTGRPLPAQQGSAT